MKKIKDSSVKIDIGCGINKREGFLGVDILKLPGVDVVLDIRGKWPWKDSSVDEINMSHTLEHFTQEERCHVMNEMYRVLKPVQHENGKAVTGISTITTPSPFSDRAYGDPTHKWPAIGDWFYLYLDKDWRDKNAPHTDIKYNKTGYSCDFERISTGYNPHPLLGGRNQEYQQHALIFWKEAAQDVIVVIGKRIKK